MSAEPEVDVPTVSYGSPPAVAQKAKKDPPRLRALSASGPSRPRKKKGRTKRSTSRLREPKKNPDAPDKPIGSTAFEAAVTKPLSKFQKLAQAAAERVKNEKYYPTTTGMTKGQIANTAERLLSQNGIPVAYHIEVGIENPVRKVISNPKGYSPLDLDTAIGAARKAYDKYLRKVKEGEEASKRVGLERAKEDSLAKLVPELFAKWKIPVDYRVAASAQLSAFLSQDPGPTENEVKDYMTQMHLDIDQAKLGGQKRGASSEEDDISTTFLETGDAEEALMDLTSSVPVTEEEAHEIDLLTPKKHDIDLTKPMGHLPPVPEEEARSESGFSDVQEDIYHALALNPDVAADLSNADLEYAPEESARLEHLAWLSGEGPVYAPKESARLEHLDWLSGETDPRSPRPTQEVQDWGFGRAASPFERWAQEDAEEKFAENARALAGGPAQRAQRQHDYVANIYFQRGRLRSKLPTSNASAVTRSNRPDRPHLSTSFGSSLTAPRNIQVPQGTIKVQGRKTTIQCSKKTRGAVVEITAFLKTEFPYGAKIGGTKYSLVGLIPRVLKSMPGTVTILS